MNHSTSRNFVLIAIIEGQLKRGQMQYRECADVAQDGKTREKMEISKK